MSLPPLASSLMACIAEAAQPLTPVEVPGAGLGFVVPLGGLAERKPEIIPGLVILANIVASFDVAQLYRPGNKTEGRIREEGYQILVEGLGQAGADQLVAIEVQQMKANLEAGK